jgi:hypothetical protein
MEMNYYARHLKNVRHLDKPFYKILIVSFGLLIGCQTCPTPPQNWGGRLNLWGSPGSDTFFVVLATSHVLYLERTSGGHVTSQVTSVDPKSYLNLCTLWRTAARAKPEVKPDERLQDGTKVRVEWREGLETATNNFHIADVDALASVANLIAAIKGSFAGKVELY